MGYQDKNQAQTSGRDAKQQRPAEQFVPEENYSFSVPNSFRTAAPMTPPPGMPNSIMREMMDEEASEAETGRFFGGTAYRSTNPIRRNRSMSAGAYAPGRSFGAGPFAGGHELSHTVRREAIPVRVGLSVPANTIQRGTEDEVPPGTVNPSAVTDPPSGTTSPSEVPAPPSGTTSPSEVSPRPSGTTSSSEVSPRPSGTTSPSEVPAPPSGTTSSSEVSPRPSGTTSPSEVPAPPSGTTSPSEVSPRPSGTTSPSEAPAPPTRTGSSSEVTASPPSSEAGDLVPKPGSSTTSTGSGSGSRSDILGDENERDDDEEADPNAGAKAQITSQARIYGADDEDTTFGSEKKSRWRISINRFSSFRLTPDVLKSMSLYYKAYCDRYNIDTTNDVDNGQILGALQDAQSAMIAQGGQPDDEPSGLTRSATDEPGDGGSSTAPVGSPAPVRSDTPDLLGEDDADAAPYAGQAAQPAYARAAINPSAGHSRRWSSAEAFRNTGASLLNIGRASVLRYHYDQLGDNRVTPKYDPKNWTLGDNDWTQQASPWLGTLMGAWNGVSGAVNMISSGDDMIKRFRNRKAGQSQWDTFQSGMDTIAGAANSMSGFWSMVQNGWGGIGKTVAEQAELLNGGAFGNAAKAVPWLGMISGGANFLSGGSQFVRGADAWRHINNSIDELNQTPSQNDPGDRNRDKLMQIFKHGKSMSQLNTWSGLMKTTSGALNAVGSGLTLGGMAPAGMAVSAAGAGLNAIKTAFDRGWKHRLRSKVVAEDYHINWDYEKDAVRRMIGMYNKKLGLRDKYVREIILRAHGSTETTRTGAFKELKLKRARYLINIANGNGEFHVVAGKVIESMGISRKGPGGKFADAAANILAEKLG